MRRLAAAQRTGGTADMSTPETKSARETWQSPKLEDLQMGLGQVNLNKGTFFDGIESGTSGQPL
jgi:hypothetical protein